MTEGGGQIQLTEGGGQIQFCDIWVIMNSRQIPYTVTAYRFLWNYFNRIIEKVSLIKIRNSICVKKKNLNLCQIMNYNRNLEILFLFIHTSEQEIAANYEKYIRARDPFPWRSIHQNLNSLGNSFCSDSNLAGATLCRYNFCTWHETHICCQGMRKICSDDQKMKYDKMKF